MTPGSNEDEFLAIWKREAKSYNDPPPPPREAMWAVIQTHRAERRLERQRRLRWAFWSAAAAAVLVIGIAVGRLTVLDTRPVPVVIAEADGSGPDRADIAFRMIADEHLWQTESLLLWLGGEAPSDVDSATLALARDLLTTTRLLLDSPASREPALKELFLDLELVLAQIVQLRADDGNTEELELIKEGINDRAVLSRLRTALPPGIHAGA